MLFATLALAGSSASQAATIQWDGEGNDFLWGTATNWFDATNTLNDVAPLATDDLVFAKLGSLPGIINLQAAQVANSLRFSIDGYTLGLAATANTLTVSSGTVTVDPAVTAVINAALTASGLNVSGGGTLVLNNAANALTGTTTVNGSTLRITAATALGAANTINSGGTLEVAGITLDRAMTLNNGATLLGTGLASSSTGVMTIASGATVAINSGTAGQTFTLGNAANDIAGGGAGTTINIGGSGTVLLTQSNALTANWKVNSGTLQIVNIGVGSLGAAASTVTVESGATLTTAPVANATINNAITLHGGTLNNGVTTGALTIGTAGLAVTAGSTIRSVGPGALGKIIVGANLLTGSGNITKVGAGALSITGLNNGYTGSYTVNEGVLEGGTGMLGSNAITLAGGELAVTNGATLSNAINITTAGSALSASTGAGTFSGPITANAAFTVNLRDYGNVGTSRAITMSGPITGSGAMSVIAPGGQTLTLTGNNTGWTGPITIGSGIAATPTVLARGITALSGKDVTLNGGILSLQTDGNGTHSPQNIVYNDNFTVTGTAGITMGRAATEFAPLFLTAANKTLQQGTLTLGGQTLTVTNNNGYGLEFTGTTTLSGAPTFSVATASASNVVQGLTLTGKVTGGFGFTKAGAGTLVLGNTTNDFAGNITVGQGGLSISDDLQLGNTSNVLSLAPTTGTATLRVTNNLTLAHSLQLGAAAANIRAIEVVAGKTLTLSSPLVIAAGSEAAALVKNDSGTLALTVANPVTWTGGVTINGGAVLVSNAGAFGAPTAPIAISPAAAQPGAVLQLSGGITLPNPISLQGTGNVFFGGIDFSGQLQSVSGENTTTGVLSANFDAAITANAGATLNVNGNVNNSTTAAHAFIVNAIGTVNLNASLTSATATPNQYFSLVKYGTGTLNITTAQPVLFTNNFTLNDGITKLTGAGTITGTNTIAVTINPGASLVLDNVGTLTPNRLGGRPVTLFQGNYELDGNSAATTETTGLFTANRGQSVVTVKAGAGGTNLVFGGAAPSRLGGSMVLFRGDGAINSTTGFAFSGTGAIGTTNKGMLPWGLFDSSATGTGTAFATADTATGVLRALAPSEMSTAFTAGDNVALSTAETPASSISINSLMLNGGSSITNTANSTLTITSGGIYVPSGSASISGGILTQGTGELIIHAYGNLDLNTTVVTGIGGANFALTKGGTGNLTLNQVSRHSGQTVIDGGTLTLNAGDNSIALQNYMFLGKGATLDLKGNLQYVTDLFTESTTLPSAGGTVTGTTGSWIVVNRDNSARTWAGQMTGNMGMVRTGLNTWTLIGANDYTGPTILQGGTTTLTSQGTLSNTSRIDLNYGILRVDNAVGMGIDLPNRVNNAAGINLRGGTLFFTGRAQASSSETFGPLTLARGVSELNATVGAAGVSSIDLNFGTLSQINNATTNFQVANGGVGNSARVFFTNGTALMSNNILPAWIEKGGNDWASYNPTQGLGAINDAGYAGYDGTAFPAAAAGTNQNIALAANGAVATGGQTLNTLNVKGAFNVTFANATDVLNLQAGGLLKTGATATFGATAGSGSLTAGGTASTGTVPLYIHTQTNGWTMNSKIIDNPNGAAVKLVYVTYNGGNMTANAQNSYSGGTVLQGWGGGNAGTFTLGATGRIPAGGLSIYNLNFVQTAGGVIDPANVLTIGSANSTTAGAITLTGNNILAGLVFDNDGGTVSPTLATGGTLTLTGGVTATSSNLGSTPVVSGTLDLNGSGKTFDMAPIAVDSRAIAPFLPTININAVIQNGGITKTGVGVLGLGGANTYTGGTAINGGTVQFTTAGAGLANSPVTVGAAGTLNLAGLSSIVGSLAGSGAVISATNGIPIVAASLLTLGGDGSSTVFGGTISGAIALSKIGGGNFQLTNPGNTFTGGVTVNSGTLQLGGAGLNTTGSGSVTINNSAVLANAGAVNGGLTFNPGSAASLGIGAVAPVSTSGLSTLGPVTVNVTGTPAIGTYSLIDYGGTGLTPAQFAGFRLGSTPGGGFVYALVNNAANTSVDLSVESLGATNTWTGASDNQWFPNDTFNWVTAYTDGQRVTFNDSGANKAITGPSPVAPQSITVSNSAGNDYSLDVPISGNLAGGFTKTGAGSVRLTGANTFTGPITVNGGTLRASVSSTGTGLASGNIALNGTVLQLDPIASNTTTGLTGRTINGVLTGNVVTQRDFNQPAIDVRTYFSAGTSGFPTGNTAAFYPGGPVDNFSVQFTGKVNITTAGVYSFFVTSDDGTRLFIDGQLVAQNDGSHGVTGGDVGGLPVLLSPGYHDVRLDYTEGTGGNEMILKWQGPGIAKAAIPSTSLFIAENATTTSSNNNILAGNNVSVTGASTIALTGNNFVGVDLGGFSLGSGSTLSVTGLSGKSLRAASTSLNGGTVTLDTTPNVALGQLLDGGTPFTLIKQGSGRLILDNTGAGGRASSTAATSLIDVRAGKLVLVGAGSNSANGGSNPAGSAKIQLNGGGLMLDTKGSTVIGANTTNIDTAITTTQNSTIEVVPSGNGGTVSVPVVIALGSAANGITLANGSTLTVDLFGGSRSATALGNNFVGNTVVANGANLSVNGVISGSAGLTVRSSQFNGGNLPVPGSITLTAANTYTGTTALRGVVYNAPHVAGGGLIGVTAANGTPLTMTLSGNGTILNTSGLTFQAARLTLDDSGTNLTAGAGRLADNLPVALNSSILNFVGNTTAASGETFGTLTANGGFNAVTMSGVATGLATTLTGNNLARANRAQLAFQGTSLGTQATASDLVKFNIVPSATLTDGVQLVGGGGVFGAATKNVSILPFAVGTTTTAAPLSWRFVGYDAANGIRPLDVTNDFEAMTGTNVGANVRDQLTAAAVAITARATDINSWILDNSTAAASTATLTGQVNVTSGALLLTTSNTTQGAVTLTGGTVNFGTAEGIITTMGLTGSTIASAITGSNGLTVGGAGQTAITADNSAGLTGTITVNGQLSIPADTALGNPNNPVNMNGGTLRFSAATTLPATRAVTLLDNTTSVFDTLTGTSIINGAITGSGGLAKISGNQLTLSNPTNNYTGRTEVYTGTLVTNSGPTGDILDNGAVTFDQTFNGTYNGSITGFGSFTKSGAGVVTFNTPHLYTGATTLSAGGLILNGDFILPMSTVLTMGSGANPISLAMNGNHTFHSMSLTTSATTNTMSIAAGKTVAVNLGMTIAGGASVTLSGGGDMTIGGDMNIGVTNTSGAFKMTAGNLSIGSGSTNNLRIGVKATATAGNVSGTFDLSGVQTFAANVGNVQMGVDLVTQNGTMGPTLMQLATNNVIVATNGFLVGDSPADGVSSGNQVILGAGINTITTPTLTIGARKIGASMTIGSGGTLNLSNGLFPTDLNIGVNSATGSATATTNSVDFTGGTVIAALNNVVIGARTGSPSGTNGGSATATLTIGTSALNNVTANSVIIGQTNASTGGTAPIGTGTGTLNMNGGSLSMGSVILAQKVSGNANGTLNLLGGTTKVDSDILDGGGTSTLVLNGGALDMQGHNIGGLTSIDNVTFASGTLANLGEFNSGATFNKTTAGTLAITGNTFYTGATTVTAGTLLVHGTLTGTPSVTVNTGATLGGSGIINAPATINGILAPGASPGDLTINGLVIFSGTSAFAVELNGSVIGTGYDQLTVDSAGSTEIDLGSTISLSLGFTPTLGQVFRVIDNLNAFAIAGTFDNLANHGTIGADFSGSHWTFEANYAGGTGNDLTLTAIAVVPEPSTALSLLGGLGLLASLRRRRK